MNYVAKLGILIAVFIFSIAQAMHTVSAIYQTDDRVSFVLKGSSVGGKQICSVFLFRCDCPENQRHFKIFEFNKKRSSEPQSLVLVDGGNLLDVLAPLTTNFSNVELKDTKGKTVSLEEAAAKELFDNFPLIYRYYTR